MQQHGCKYFARSHTLGPGVGSEGHFLLKVVLLHIKLKGLEHRAPCKNILCPYTHPQALGCGQNVMKFSF